MAEPEPALPVAAFRDEVVSRLRDERVLIVVGETGSGKTTQLCQYALEGGLVAPGRMVAISQPRRLAAIAAARRVAEERGCRVGEEVAYTVRFDDTASEATRIRFITDGSLLREAVASPTLERYSLIIMDEAHERSLNTDILLGLLRQLLRSGARPDLRVVIASATLDAAKFSAFFDGCRAIQVPGRMFPVDIYHVAPSEEAAERARSVGAEQYVESAVELCMRLHRSRPVGPNEDVLVFLTGAKEIGLACAALEQLAALDAASGGAAKPMVVLPLHAGLSAEAQARVFAKSSARARKVVVATNIAETSLTIDGIRAVLDCGQAKLHSFDSVRGMELLTVQHISKSAARQRAGRAGRTRAGECYRLYSEAQFAKLEDETEPEIRRASLAATALALKAMGVVDLLAFDLLDPPPRAALLRALVQLHAIGALDDGGRLTALGSRIATLPVEPRLGAALAAAAELGCLEELATIAAMLSGEDPFVRTPSSGNERDGWSRARARLAETQAGADLDAGEADHFVLLHLYQDFALTQPSATGAWASKWSVHLRAMHAARDVRAQLLALLTRAGLGGPNRAQRTEPFGVGRAERARGAADAVAGAAEPLGRRIRRAICAGYFANAVRRIGSGGDACVMLAPPAGGGGGGGGAGAALLHPLAQSAPVLHRHLTFVYHELVWTSAAHMRHLCRAEREWLDAPLRRLERPVDALVLAGAARTPQPPAKKRAHADDGNRAGGAAPAAARPSQAEGDARVQEARERYLKRREERS
ncbi:P-loop containing nucleoside triphosphate hydrolase protein [Pavlovales sp. CCMP2436]|nr:P-loop containing nucleoside triphosphate hydrolase protein [Pavlovales sp. CCMP2436]